jgi:hypothetical protein
MRRFYEIELTEDVDRELLHKIDFEGVWSGIDAAQEGAPYIREHMADLQVVQESSRYKSSVEEFIHEFEIKPGRVRVKLRRIFDYYKPFCEQSNYKALGYQSFLRELPLDVYEYGNQKVCNLDDKVVDKHFKDAIQSFLVLEGGNAEDS